MSGTPGAPGTPPSPAPKPKPSLQPRALNWHRFPIALTIAYLVCLSILISLGNWQVRRLDWKSGLIADLSARQSTAPIPFEEALTRALAGEDLQFQPVTITGYYRHDAQFAIPGIRDATPGWRVITPFIVRPNTGNATERNTQSPSRPLTSMVLVERGFVKGIPKIPPDSPEQTRGTTTSLTAQIRPQAKSGWLDAVLLPQPDFERGVLHRLDRQAMAMHAARIAPQTPESHTPGTKAPDPQAPDSQAQNTSPQLAPFDVIARTETPQPSAPANLIRSRIRVADISNRHLEYVVTWYGLALALTGVFIVMLVGRLRQS